MIYNTENINNINLKKYKRHFSFGCSFTNYYWPTWADIIAHEMPDAGYINTAKPGAGNSYILAKLSQAIRYYNIGEDDLVTIMWTTMYRQDSYRNRAWETPGNIFSQGDIPMEIVHQYLDDTVGFAIRDYAIIDTATKMVESQSFDSVMMWGVDPEQQDYYGLSMVPEAQNDWRGLQVFYKDLNSLILPSLLEVGCGGQWGQTFSFENHEGDMQVDYHPNTETYFNYLANIGFGLSAETKDWALGCDKRTAAVKKQSDLEYLHHWFDFA